MNNPKLADVIREMEADKERSNKKYRSPKEDTSRQYYYAGRADALEKHLPKLKSINKKQ